MTTFPLLLAAASLAGMAQAYIQAGAYLNGCVYYAEKPFRPIQVNFQAGISGTQCMDSNGNSGSFVVTEGGVTCYDMGYVENKPYDSGWDNCVVRDSLWGVSYNTNMSQSGSTSSYWTANYKGRDYNEMYLEKQVAGTNICGSAAQCSNSEFDWSYGTTPTYYLIFEPEKNAQFPLETALPTKSDPVKPTQTPDEKQSNQLPLQDL